MPVPVRENLFLIGLSNLQHGRGAQHRSAGAAQLDRPADPPVSGQRAIVSFEKGVVGEQVMNDAFRQWQCPTGRLTALTVRNLAGHEKAAAETCHG